MAKVDKPAGLDPASFGETVDRIMALARQLATGQPCTHEQFRRLVVAHQNLGVALAHAGEVPEDE